MQIQGLEPILSEKISNIVTITAKKSKLKFDLLYYIDDFHDIIYPSCHMSVESEVASTSKSGSTEDKKLDGNPFLRVLLTALVATT